MDKWTRMEDPDVNPHHSATGFLTDMPKVYTGEKAASSINSANRMGVPK